MSATCWPCGRSCVDGLPGEQQTSGHAPVRCVSRRRSRRRSRSGRSPAGSPRLGSPAGPNPSSGGTVIARRVPTVAPCRPSKMPGSVAPSCMMIWSGSLRSHELNTTTSLSPRTSSMWTTAVLPSSTVAPSPTSRSSGGDLERPDGRLDLEIERGIIGGDDGHDDADLDHVGQRITRLDHVTRRCLAVRQVARDVESHQPTGLGADQPEIPALPTRRRRRARRRSERRAGSCCRRSIRPRPERP